MVHCPAKELWKAYSLQRRSAGINDPNRFAMPESPYSLVRGCTVEYIALGLEIFRVEQSWSIMSTAEQALFDAALSLPEPSRAHLAEVLLASLPEEDEQAPAVDELPQAWLTEIRRRRQEIEEGKVELVPGEEVMARLRQRTDP